MRFTIDSHKFEEFTPAFVQTLCQELGQAVSDAQAQVLMCESAAAALAPMAHHKQINAAAATRLQKSVPELYARLYVQYGHKSLHLSLPVQHPEGSRKVSNCPQRGPSQNKLDIRLEDGWNVADLIKRLADCPLERAEAATLTNQLDSLSALIDTEKSLRSMLANFENLRSRVGLNVMGRTGSPMGPYYHETIRKALPALTATR